MTRLNLPARLVVGTLVSHAEQHYLDALSDSYDFRPLRSPEELRERLVADAAMVGALVGPRILDGPRARVAVAHIIRQFPRHRFVGLIGAAGAHDRTADAFAFGRLGVDHVADVSQDFYGIRAAFSDAADPFLVSAVAKICANVGTPSWRRLMADVFDPAIAKTTELADRQGIHPSTLNSRFFRAGLPSPKKYIAWARLTYTAHLGETPGFSTSTAAVRLRASSTQAFTRSVRCYGGLTPAEFRRTYTGEEMIERYRRELITPYTTILRTFDPHRDDMPERAAAA